MITISYVNFTHLGRDELEMIHRWRNLPYIRKYMDNSREFSLEEHLKFCESLKSRTDKMYFLVKVDGVPCGVVNRVDIDMKTRTSGSGIYVIEEYQRLSYAVSRGSAVINRYLGLERILGHCKKANDKAVLFNVMKLKGKIEGEDEECLYFSYPALDDLNAPFYKKYSIEVKM